MRKRSPFKTRLEYTAARLILGALGIMPRRLAIALGLFTAWIGYLLLGRLRRVGHINIQIAFPDMSSRERKKLLKGSFESLGRMLGEVSKFQSATPQWLTEIVEFDFEPHERSVYEAERAKGRGTILAGPHLGNWEIGVFAYSAIYEPLSYLARPLDNPMVEDLIARIRARFGNRAINKRNSVQKAISILNAGETLGVLPDVNVQEKDGVFVPFFGRLACTTAGVALLAKRTNAMIIPMCTVWDAATRKYRVKHGRIITAAATGDRHRDLAETTAEMTAAMEEFVRAYPDQWLWIHKRWKTRPAGEQEIY